MTRTWSHTTKSAAMVAGSASRTRSSRTSVSRAETSPSDASCRSSASISLSSSGSRRDQVSRSAANFWLCPRQRRSRIWARSCRTSEMRHPSSRYWRIRAGSRSTSSSTGARWWSESIPTNAARCASTPVRSCPGRCDQRSSGPGGPCPARPAPCSSACPCPVMAATLVPGPVQRNPSRPATYGTTSPPK